MSLSLGLSLGLSPSAASAPAAFDPLTLSPVAWYARGDYSASAPGTWTKTNGVNVTGTGSPYPSASAGCPVSNSATDYPLANASPLSAWGGSGNKHVVAVLDITAITGPIGAHIYRRAAVLEATDQYIGMYVHRTGTAGSYQYFLTYYEYDTNERGATVEITALVDGAGAGRIVAQGRKVGGHVEVKANGGAWVTGDACGATGGTTGGLRIFGMVSGLACVARYVGTWTSALGDTDSASLATWGATA
jgi:hypothetical protein